MENGSKMMLCYVCCGWWFRVDTSTWSCQLLMLSWWSVTRSAQWRRCRRHSWLVCRTSQPLLSRSLLMSLYVWQYKIDLGFITAAVSYYATPCWWPMSGSVCLSVSCRTISREWRGIASWKLAGRKTQHCETQVTRDCRKVKDQDHQAA